MNSLDEIFDIATLKVEVKKRDVKSLRIGVFPPTGRVRVTAPLNYDQTLIESVVLKKMSWIRRQQQALRTQERQSPREGVSGESYFYKGNKYKLFVVHDEVRGRLEIKNSKRMELHISDKADQKKRVSVIDAFYRNELKSALDELVPKLSKSIGVPVPQYGIRKMKNRWGSCDTKNAHISLNIELIKKNPSCLKYIIVHEIVHLIEPKHNDNFKNLMDKNLSNWRFFRDLLNSSPLAHANWDY